MRQYTTFNFRTKDDIATITLNQRPTTINAHLISELKELCDTLAKLSNIRAVILNSSDNDFGVGADMQWMQEQSNKVFNENKNDAIELAAFFHALNTLPQPLIGVTQGKSYGMSLNLLASCDYVFAHPAAVFCLNEVKLGLIPAVSTPFLIRKIGYSQLRALAVTATPFNADTALNIGLVHHISHDTLQDANHLASRLKENAPMAVAQTKRHLDQFFPIEPQMIDYTAETLAHIRISDEAQTRMKIFLGKNEG